MVEEPAAPAAPVVERVEIVWSREEQRALEKALKTYPVSMEKKERWMMISKAVNAAGEGGKGSRKCLARFKDLRAEAQRTAGLGKLNQKDPDWKLKKKADQAKAKGYHTTTQDPDQRKKAKMKKDDEGKNKFKEAAKAQGTGGKKKKKSKK